MKIYTFVVFACILIAASSFHISALTNYTSQGFKKIVTKFGQKFWQKNHTDYEETIFET